MTFEESIPLAKQLAENQLRKGFDVEAFLILCEIDRMTKGYDLVPESNVDETIMDIQGLFVNYMHNRSIENLDLLLSTIRKMLSELYNSCTLEEKQSFKEHLSNLSTIYNTTKI